MRSTGRLRRFARRHDRLISFIAASVVLITFIVKDEIRQDLKDLVDSIDQAENVFMIRSDSRDLGEQVEYLQQDLGDKGTKWRRLASSDRYYRSVTAELDSALHLLAKVPHDEVFDREASDLSTKLSKWMSNSLTRVAPLPEGPTVRDEAAEARTRKLKEKLSADAYLLDTQTRGFGARVVDMARKVEVREERRYRVTKYVSYLVYLIGWVLGLFGTMFGAEGRKATNN